MERVSTSKPDLFMRHIEEGAPLGADAESKSRSQGETGGQPGPSPAGREEVGNV